MSKRWEVKDAAGNVIRRGYGSPPNIVEGERASYPVPADAAYGELEVRKDKDKAKGQKRWFFQFRNLNGDIVAKSADNFIKRHDAQVAALSFVEAVKKIKLEVEDDD